MVKADEAARLPSVSPGFRAIHAANRVMVAIQQDDMAAALDWGNRLLEYPDDILNVWLQHVPPRLLIARGEKAAAAEKLRGVYEKAVHADAQGFAIRIRVYQALAAPTPAEALAFLAEALKMGQPEGFIRTFVDEGKLLAPLLRQALAQGILPEYAGMLLNIIQAEERQRMAVHREAPPSLPPAGPVSQRELEVLRLMAAGLSNKQIAEKLSITTGTVKSHVHNIIEKLYAQGRTQAISQARVLKLI
jgi:LuxR family transcriptional regulator, maltose regulon positive regulatory protein